MLRNIGIACVVMTVVSCCVAEEDSPLAGDSLIAPGAKLEKLADGFTFLEGPAAAPNGDLYFVDLRVNKILIWSIATKQVSMITDDSKGMNGMQFDSRGRIVGCQGDLRRIVACDPKNGEVLEVLADQYDGKRFNNPNDLWIDPKGGIYFTDPAYSRKKTELEQDGRHVYYIPPGGKPVIRVADTYNTPNGIVGSLDGKSLTITDRRLGRTWRYAIEDSGALSQRQLVCKVGADGMTLDERGNLYTTPRAPSIRVFDPQGKELAAIGLPTSASNVCFAGPNRKTLFITTSKALYSLEMSVAGQ